MRYLWTVVLLSVLNLGVGAADENSTNHLWYGTMDVGTRLFRFRLEPILGADHLTERQLFSLDEGGQVFRLDNFQLDDAEPKFGLKLTKATYAGKLTDGGKTSTGSWNQSGKDFDLILRRVEVVPVDRPAEIWTGTMHSLFQKLTMRFRVYREDDDTEHIYFDSVSQKAGGFKAVRTTQGDQWTINVAAIGGVFEGVLNAEKTEVKGKLTQGGATLDLVLTQEKSLSAEPVNPPVRPQTPVAPFPYLIEEVSFRNEAEGVQLAGTLTIPLLDHPCPAVVLISGSGPQDRDETLLDHKPFWVIADHLSRHGIAVLRFDDRGTGASQGDFSSATSENFANDAEAAFDQLARDDRIAPNSIGLMGHSEGGLIAPMVAARRNDIAFTILLAGTGVNGKEILLSQGQLILQAEGVTDKNLLNIQRMTQLAMIDTVLETAPTATLDVLIAAAMLRITELLPEELRSEDSLKGTVSAGIQRMHSPWFRFFLTYEPATLLQQVKCPVLALNGEKDVQVDPRLNLLAIEAALEKGGNTRFRTVEFPALNHLFQSCTTGSLSEYETIEETISLAVLQIITAWITEVTTANSIQ
ncbi:MAG: alpha/beta fold hydrolase [Planctomycetales bacterium]|nr:alpha/beta fold hydrolase [Planctomycetales bacterium]